MIYSLCTLQPEKTRSRTTVYLPVTKPWIPALLLKYIEIMQYPYWIFIIIIITAILPEVEFSICHKCSPSVVESIHKSPGLRLFHPTPILFHPILSGIHYMSVLKRFNYVCDWRTIADLFLSRINQVGHSYQRNFNKPPQIKKNMWLNVTSSYIFYHDLNTISQ